MHSLEMIRVMNEKAALKKTRQKLVGMELVNADTGERQSTRTFVTIDSAHKYCDFVGADFLGQFAK